MEILSEEQQDILKDALYLYALRAEVNDRPDLAAEANVVLAILFGPEGS